jgi:hypothetical protein
MRIACLHIPQFALQSLSRVDPSLRGAAVAVVGAGVDPGPGVRPQLALHSPIVLACSRAAWALGVRLGMTASAARFVSADLRVVAADTQLERETVRAIADALLGVSAVVDTGGRVAVGGAHLAMYCEVPSKVRGTTFGERLIELLATFGLAARIGIADDRFTAWVAAAHGGGEPPATMADSASTVREAVDARRARAPRASEARRAGASSSDSRNDGSAPGIAVPDPTTTGGTQPLPGVPQQRVAGRRRGVGSPRQATGASDERGVVSVPRGGSAAFLSPRPLSLLAITPEVQHMLEALGVRTLGEFAALPAPSVARPLEADYQALARGDGGSVLRPYTPEAPIREELVASHAGSLFGGASVVQTIARRLALRLSGRARAASRLDVTITSENGERAMPVTLGRAVSSQHEIIELLAPLVGEGLGSAKLRVVVVGEAIVGASGELEAAADGASGPTGSNGSIDGLTLALATGAKRRRRRPSPNPLPAAQPARAKPWQLIAPQTLRAERRDVHRRTRRAKPRRRPVVLAQSQLFGNGDS